MPPITQFKVGDVVRDKFKSPRPGEPDDVCEGIVREVTDKVVVVEMTYDAFGRKGDHGQERRQDPATASRIFTLVTAE